MPEKVKVEANNTRRAKMKKGTKDYCIYSQASGRDASKLHRMEIHKYL